MRIVVLGYLVRGPLGGMAWHHLQYAMGLADLGHDVYFLEDSGGDGASCYDPRSNAMTADPSYGLAFAGDALARTGLGERWAYYDAHTRCWHGPMRDAAQVCRTADLLLNVSSSNRLREWHLAVPRRALIDTDPLFTQVRHLASAEAIERARRHTDFFTFGENVGRGSGVPDDGLPWLPTRQPIVLRAWPVTAGDARASYTTVMQWESYRCVEYRGVHYGMKARSFEPYIALPRGTSAALEVAVGAPQEIRAQLAANGWRVANPLEVASDPWRYQQYIRDSRAELTVAKHGYVASRCGWFSERSASYLASGRPVVTQDTGFASWLPAGEGVLAFDSPDTALAALEDVERRYAHHCREARRLAEEYFDSAKVLRALLERIGRERAG